MTLELPEPNGSAPVAPTPATPAERDETYRPLRALVGMLVEVHEVEDLDGIPVVWVAHDDGRLYGYLATGEWAAAGATHLQAFLATRGGDEPVQVQVVEHENGTSGVGFRKGVAP